MSLVQNAFLSSFKLSQTLRARQSSPAENAHSLGSNQRLTEALKDAADVAVTVKLMAQSQSNRHVEKMQDGGVKEPQEAEDTATSLVDQMGVEAEAAVSAQANVVPEKAVDLLG